MKIKFFILSIFLMLFCCLARGQGGQEGIDTMLLLRSYEESEPQLKQLINSELTKHGQLNINRYGKYSCPFSQAVENTFIKIALENRGLVQINLDYYNLDFFSNDLKDEYFLQQTIQKNYPNKLLDFLELKMVYNKPVTLNMLVEHRSFLLLDDLEERFYESREGPIEPVKKRDIGGGNSFTYINNTSLHDLMFPEFIKADDDCECYGMTCWLNCMDMEQDFLENIIWTTCSTACLGGATGPVPAFICLQCISLLTSAGISCANDCSQDPCSHYTCKPGTEKPGTAFCDNQNNRRAEICDCDGEGYTLLAAPCPPGTICCDGECITCFIAIPAPDPKGNAIEFMNNDDVYEFISTPSEDEICNADKNLKSGDSPCDCNYEIGILAQIEHESFPESGDGSITVSPTNGFPLFKYRWEDSSTSATRNDLSPGDYCVTITDRYCCFATDCFTIETEACIGVEWDLDFSVIPSCNGDDGIISSQVISGGQSPYSYQWDNGATTPGLDDIAPGAYTLTIYDSNGCNATYTIHVTGLDPNISTEINGIVTSVCPDQASSGAIDLLVSSSSSVTEFNWSNGASTRDIEDLSPGTYNVTITDECENTESASFTVGLIEMTSSSIPASNASCNGSVDISIDYGTPPYFYTIDELTQGGYFATESTSASSLSFSNLCPANYLVSVSDANGCFLSSEESILDCPETTYGDWYYESNITSYCQDYWNPGNSVCPELSGQNCFTPSYGQWIFNGSEYCRTVSCPINTDCEGFNITEECITPTFTNWENDGNFYCAEVTCTGTFCDEFDIIDECFYYSKGDCVDFNDDTEDQEYCVCEIDLQNGPNVDLTGQFDPEIEWDYDDNSNKCIKTFFCDGSEVEEYDDVEPTDQDDWEFNESNLTCTRTISCGENSNEESFDDTEETIEVEWEYQEGSGCIATITCVTDQDSYELDDEVNGDDEIIDWDFNENNFTCIATIECTLNNSFEYETEEVSYADIETIAVGQIGGGAFHCIIGYECENDGPSGSTPGALAECTEGPGEWCTYSCDGFTAVNDCNDQCPGLGPIIAEGRENSLEESNNSTFIQVSPNPFKEEITINDLPLNQGKLNVEIVDSGSALIYSIQSLQRPQLVINTTNFNKGMYFLKVYNKDRSFSKIKKIVKVY